MCTERIKLCWPQRKMQGNRNIERKSLAPIQISRNCANLFWAISYHRVQRMCDNWESALSHGLKTQSVFKSIVSGHLTTEVSTTSFWNFAYTHLTTHEKERFSTLRYSE